MASRKCIAQFVLKCKAFYPLQVLLRGGKKGEEGNGS